MVRYTIDKSGSRRLRRNVFVAVKGRLGSSPRIKSSKLQNHPRRHLSWSVAAAAAQFSNATPAAAGYKTQYAQSSSNYPVKVSGLLPRFQTLIDSMAVKCIGLKPLVCLLRAVDSPSGISASIHGKYAGKSRGANSSKTSG